MVCIEGVHEIAAHLATLRERQWAPTGPAEQARLAELQATLDRAEKEIKSALTIARDLARRPVGRPPRQQRPITVRDDLRFAGMGVAEAAVALGFSEEYVRRQCRRGVLVGVPFGGKTGWRLPRDYILDLQRKIEAAQEGKEAARRRLIGAPKVARPRKKPV